MIFVVSACNTPSSDNHIVSTADTSYRQTAEHNTERGREVFQAHCVTCHGLNGNYRNNNAADLHLSRADSLTIVTTVINGKGAMPMFAHVIPDSDLAQLELYVKTLRN